MDVKIETSTSQRLKEAMELRDMKQADLVRVTGIDKASISLYVSGKYSPKGDKLYKLAMALDVSSAWLSGFNVPMQDNDEIQLNNNIEKIQNIIPFPKTSKKPRLGTIACGEPILAQENIEDYDEVPEDIRCDFTLICSGDSMINARINNGDIVYIREQPQVENGEIAACLVDGEFETKATLKRFYKYDDKIILQAENPAYPPFVYVNEEMNKVRIIGKAVGFTSKL